MEKYPSRVDIAVLLLFFTRSDTFQQVFNEVRKARPSRLFLFQDGPRGERDMAGIEACRQIVSDEQIVMIVQSMPRDLAELRHRTGMWPRTLERYGDAILACLERLTKSIISILSTIRKTTEAFLMSIAVIFLLRSTRPLRTRSRGV